MADYIDIYTVNKGFLYSFKKNSQYNPFFQVTIITVQAFTLQGSSSLYPGHSPQEQPICYYIHDSGMYKREEKNSYHSITSIAAATLSIQKSTNPIAFPSAMTS